MVYPIEIRERAVKFRKKGHSLNELHALLNVSKGRLSDWMREVRLPVAAIKRLDRVVRKGRVHAAETNKERRRKIIESYREAGKQEIKSLLIDKNMSRLICALMYHCEGRKSLYSPLSFTNSDANLVQVFLRLLRKGFEIDESKFRVCVHLHEYHNEREQLRFWSKATNIPLSQFMRPYLKPNTGKRVRNGYNGCAAVSYFDVNVAREVLMIADAFLRKHVGP